MEYASEMIVRAAMCGLTMIEVPVTLAPDGRGRKTASVAVARRLAGICVFFCFTVRAGFIFIRAWQ